MEKTYMAKKGETERKAYLINAEGKVLGKLAAAAARILMGKNKPEYTPHVITGDSVIVINAGKVVLTGKKSEKKTYIRHSGYPGGFKEEKFSDLIRRRPEEVIIQAVSGMLPKTKLGDAMIKHLRVHRGSTHRMSAQKPVEINNL